MCGFGGLLLLLLATWSGLSIRGFSVPRAKIGVVHATWRMVEAGDRGMAFPSPSASKTLAGPRGEVQSIILLGACCRLSIRESMALVALIALQMA